MAHKMLFGYNFGKLSVAVIPTYQAKAEREDWMDVDITELADELQLAYMEYKDSYRATKALREAFEAKMRGMAGVVAKASSRAPRQSLSDYLAARQ